ncbi:hypothetical protein HF086_005003 [Spodoptera exigua]|uniref:SEC63 domain-containing protein n=1 Tax=Spodoptera exigua TaxID=7107 RepID=A0A922M2K0_SPOEX|nr:hypothetical protein HF086_005003 [Spodoptera exigua]
MVAFYLPIRTRCSRSQEVEGSETLERLLTLICESHELADMHLRVDERRCLNLLNRNQAAATIRFPMKGKISTRQMKLNCIIQAVLGCLPIPDPSLNQEAMKIMRIADRVCKCLVTYVTRPDLVSQQPRFYSAVLNSIFIAKCVAAHLWENSPYVSKQLKGIGPTFSTLLASAGKVNFILLEESHPRDLERIMNKGAPAGNVLRKQISLLPKYQLTMIPVDEKTVTLQLLLINQSYLAENMENLTAGERHKSYIIVGDSNNHLLLLATFKDKDLISVFDGIINHKIIRKHSFEHKIFAHCISSSFVGIDAHAEYLFSDLEPFLGGTNTQKKSIQKNSASNKKVTERQTCITDTFKERKRKNTDAIEKSKEKKKRESAMIESFKYLKQSFETAAKNVNQSMHHQTISNKENTNNIAVEHSEPSNSNWKDIGNTKQDNKQNPSTIHNIVCCEDMDSDEAIDEEKIDSILNEIEIEMNKGKPNFQNSKTSFWHEKDNTQTPDFNKTHSHNSMHLFSTKKCTNQPPSGIRKRKPLTTKSNYNFIELLERKLSISDNEDVVEIPQKDNGFSDTIKSQVQKYLTKTKTSIPDKNAEIVSILGKLQNEELTKPDQPCPTYVIKEILGHTDSNVHNSKVQETKNISRDQDVGCIKTKTDTYKRDSQFGENYDSYELANYKTSIKRLTDFSDKSNLLLGSEKHIKPSTKNQKEDKNMEIVQDNNDTEVANFNELNQNYKQCVESDIQNLENETNSIDETDVVMKSPTTESIQYPDTIEIENFTKHESVVNTRDSSEPNKDKLVEDNVGEPLKYISGQIIPQNVNQLLVTNKTSCTDVANREDFAPSVSSHQADCEQNICASSVSSFILPPTSNLRNTQNTSNHFSKDIETDQLKTKFVQRYSYVASKIDVCTKQTPEYSMQVIKKLKMDVDITAIVSRKHSSFQNSHTECDQNSDDKNKIIELLKQDNADGQDSGIIISACNNERNSTSNVFTPIHFSTTESSAMLPNEGSEPEVMNSNVKNKNEASPDQNSTNTESFLNTDVNEMPSSSYYEHLVTNDNCRNISQTASGNTSVNENKIQNILQKYSKKLSTNTVKPLTPSCSSFASAAFNNSPQTKIRKPFKITDLHKLHATIPDTIVEQTIEKNKNPSPKINLLVESTKQLKKLDQSELRQNSNTTPIRDILDCGSMTELNLEPVNEYLSPKLDLEPKVYKIDQSMFNPKTLLQCVADDGHELVPPPPEFCDDISYSPCLEADLVACTTNEILTSQLNNFTNNDEVCNESIFDDDTCDDLTPSREIETWILPQDDDDHESNLALNISPSKSYTVIRKNCSNSNFSYKNIMSRQARLGKFRFSQKNKFKTKK